MKDPKLKTTEKEFEEEVLQIRRVSKKTPGGNYITFSALVAVGDRKGRVGVGIAKATEVPPAIRKAAKQAEKSLITVPLKGTTIPHNISVKYKAAKILLKPAPVGTGLKVGSVVRKILGLAGVKDVSGKVIGSRNKIVNSYAVIKALKSLKKMK